MNTNQSATALLVIDMQRGVLERGAPRYQLDAVVERINRLAQAMRDSNGLVIFVQHQDDQEGSFQSGSEGWQLSPDLVVRSTDRTVCKTACDAFYKTELQALLHQHGIKQLVITGCATDFCVDTTVRAAVSLGFDLLIVEDAHTTADRSHLPAIDIIRHHNWVWADLIAPDTEIQLMTSAAIEQALQ